MPVAPAKDLLRTREAPATVLLELLDSALSNLSSDIPLNLALTTSTSYNITTSYRSLNMISRADHLVKGFFRILAMATFIVIVKDFIVPFVIAHFSQTEQVSKADLLEVLHEILPELQRRRQDPR